MPVECVVATSLESQDGQSRLSRGSIIVER